MGGIRKHRKKYETPSHLWKLERILKESELQRTYGLKNNREIWRARSLLRKFRQRAKCLLAGEGREEERESLLKKLAELKLKVGSVEEVLSLGVEDILERRLQTLVYRKGLAKSIKQARQLITHGHVLIGDRKVTRPSYLVPKEEEALIRLRSG